MTKDEDFKFKTVHYHCRPRQRLPSNPIRLWGSCALARESALSGRGRLVVTLATGAFLLCVEEWTYRGMALRVCLASRNV